VRTLFLLFIAVTGMALAASQSVAQCCYIVPPRAPDMRNPGSYWTNCYGVTYGPNYYVQPPFPPFQGMILAPKKPGAPAGPAGPGGLPTPREIQAGCELKGFPRHLYARSPRDFFMVETDPRTSPYNYGYASPGLPGALYGGGNGANGSGLGGDKGLGGYAGE
jgi:hypothetical protein